MTVTVTAAVFAVILGTNSFAVSLGGKMPPNLGLFGSSGVYEIASYVLASAATISIARWRTVGLTKEAVVLPYNAMAILQRNVGLEVAVLVLAAATGVEAYRFAAAIAR